MVTKTEISEFYRKSEIVLKPYSPSRIYKIQHLNGKWETIKNQVRTPEQLRKILIKKAPLNVFSSCSAWLNPLNVEHPSYKYADRILLSNLVFIDIDSHDARTFNNIWSFFEKRPRYRFWKAKDSGNGYGIYYEDTKSLNTPNPKRRIEKLRIERMLLLLGMFKEGITNFDWEVIIDPYRVSRVIGTLNEGEKICKEINAPLSIKESLERPKADEREVASLSFHHPTAEQLRSAPPRLSASSHYFYNFIDSKIYGIKGKYCVYIKKRKNYGYPRFIKLLKKLQEIYRLSDFYVFETEDFYDGLCLKGVDMPRLLKILRMAKSITLNPVVKYGHSWIKIGKVMDNNFKIVEDKPVFKEVIENLEYRQNYHSLPHMEYLKEMEVPLKDYSNLFGKKIEKYSMAKVKV